MSDVDDRRAGLLAALRELNTAGATKGWMATLDVATRMIRAARFAEQAAIDDPTPAWLDGWTDALEDYLDLVRDFTVKALLAERSEQLGAWCAPAVLAAKIS